MTRMPVSAETRSTRRPVAWWLTGIALVLAAGACTSSTSTGSDTSCSLNSDCTLGLICALGKCRSECVNASDCPVPESSCIDDGRYPVCETPTEKNTPCTKEADCPVPLACASDYRCRNLCLSAADCNVLGITGRDCAADKNGVYYCADPNEVTNNTIDVMPPPGAPTSTPVVEPGGGAIVASLPPGILIATSIGQAGGTIGAMGVTVVIPPGALMSSVTITIQLSQQPGPSGTVSQVFEIGPTGTMFATPATIAFDYTDSELAGLAPSDFAVETSADSGASWTPLSQIVVDVYAHTIAGQTAHLSPYALVQQPGGDVSVVDSGTPASADSGSGGTLADGGGSGPPSPADGGGDSAPDASP